MDRPEQNLRSTCTSSSLEAGNMPLIGEDAVLFRTRRLTGEAALLLDTRLVESVQLSDRSTRVVRGVLA